MTVYIDDASIVSTAGPHTSRWSHLLADTRGELHDFADALGLRREWFQDAATTWHYDLTEGKRGRAIQLGAEAVTGARARTSSASARRGSRPRSTSHYASRSPRGSRPPASERMTQACTSGPSTTPDSGSGRQHDHG